MIYNQVFFCLFSIIAVLLISRQKDARGKHLILAATNQIFLGLLFYWSQSSQLILLGLLGFNFAVLKLQQTSARRFASEVARFLVGVDLAFFIFSNDLKEASSPFFLVGLGLLILRLIHLALEADSLSQPLTILRYLNFSLFFPTYLSGPVARYDEFISQFENAAPLNAERTYRALVRITVGFFKVQVLAFMLGPFTVQASPTNLLVEAPPALVFLFLFAHTVWFYFSFSGISDVAIGFGELLGVSLPENFNRPFIATNLQDFWQRWHISVLDWAREYIYVPIHLRLSRSFLLGRPLACTAISVTISFVLLGCWHGPGRHFFRYGLFHGTGMVIFLVYARTIRDKVNDFCSASNWRNAGAHGLAWAITWTHVSIGWLFYLDKESVLYSMLNKL